MAEVTDKQRGLIAKLVKARKTALTPLPDWMKPPTTTYEASKLIERLFTIPADPDPAVAIKADELKARINEVKANDQAFAQSLLSQYARRGTLSDKQVESIDSILAKIDVPDAEPGFYKVPEGIVYAYITRNKRLTTKSFVLGSWDYTGQKMLTECTPDRKMTGEQVAEFGRSLTAQGICIVCAAEGRDPTLTDPRSIAAGYGADCAARFGWHYPTKEEAERILNSK